MNHIKYHEDKNPNGDFLPGVPLDDLTLEQFEALPIWLQASITACPFYTVPVKARPVMPEPARQSAEPADDETVVLTPSDVPARMSATAVATKRRAHSVRSANG